MRTCSKCNQAKPLGAFIKRADRPQGRGYHCLECDRDRIRVRREGSEAKCKQQAYYRTHVVKLRAQMHTRRQTIVAVVEGYKDRPCLDCGKQYASVCMDFDHLAAKKYNVGSLKTYALVTVRQEIAKCEVVCANCHRLRTAANWVASQDRRKASFNARLAKFKAVPCADCNTFYPSVVLEFDHLPDRGPKVANISGMWAQPWGAVEAELMKCDIVCVNCHRLRTQARKRAA